jgi:hypothetical protein
VKAQIHAAQRAAAATARAAAAADAATTAAATNEEGDGDRPLPAFEHGAWAVRHHTCARGRWAALSLSHAHCLLVGWIEPSIRAVQHSCPYVRCPPPSPLDPPPLSLSLSSSSSSC